MNNFKYIFGLVVLLIASCTIDDQTDPNAPSINSVLTEATAQQLNLLAAGVESSMRNGMETYAAATGSVAREMYKFDADPRNTEDLLGKGGVALDNNTFYLTAVYNTRYRCIKTANILLDALSNTSSVSQAQKDGYSGYAKTIKALMYSQVLDYLGTNGVRFDVADPENLGPFLSESDGRAAILGLLNEALGEINSGTMDFPLSAGFDGFNTPSTFAQFNRAIAARVAARGGDYSAASGFLANSFMSMSGDLATGPKHTFSISGGDLPNTIFKPMGQSGDQLVVHNRFLENATAGDARLSKFRERVNATSQDGLNGTHETALYASASSPVDIIRNEELILLAAEIAMQTADLNGAVDAINVIRNAHGIGDYSGAVNADAVTNEWLYQKSYSFWGEGQHMFDLRKYGRLNDTYLPIDRDGDLIHTQFPIPLSENQ